MGSSVAARRCCFVGGPGCAALAFVFVRPDNAELELAAAPACWLPGCAAPAELSEFCEWPRRMFRMEAPRCRLVGMPGCAAEALSNGRLPVHPATAGCSALLAGAPAWPTKLARSLQPSVITACCNSVISVGNGRSCPLCFRRTFHETQRGLTSSCRGFCVFVSTKTAARSCSKSGVLHAAPCTVNQRFTAAMELNVSAGCSTLPC